MSYGGSFCVQQWDLLYWVLQLSAACDRSEGSRDVHWKVLHSRWTVVLQLCWSALQWTLSGSYFTAGGQWYCSLNGVLYIEHYLEDTSQLVDSGVAAWMECVTVNIMWRDTSQQVDSGIAAWMECFTLNIIWKILRSWWTVVLQLCWSALQWTLSGRYFTAYGQCYCSLNTESYKRHYRKFLTLKKSVKVCTA